jgi:ribosomal protein S18 acetylase RimI-like enzyme
MGKPRYTLILSQQPTEEERGIVTAGLDAFSESLGDVPPFDYQPVAAFVKDNGNQILGGLIGGTYWQWLHVQSLWVDSVLRGEGFGRDLLLTAEREAVRRGCIGAYVNTHDFQALGFYQKQGYAIAGELADFPPGYRRYMLQKRF